MIVRLALVIGVCTALGGCTVSQEIKNQCLAMGFEPGSDRMADCQLRLTEAAMSNRGGGAPMMPPAVESTPLPMPQRSQTVRVQASCSTYQMGNYQNTNCY